MASVCSLADPKVQRKSYTRARFKANAVTSPGREIDIEAISQKTSRALLSVIALNNTFMR